ncbi:MAG: multicopper oxidase domain-containing protein [Paenibacillaceae bacterium]
MNNRKGSVKVISFITICMMLLSLSPVYAASSPSSLLEADWEIDQLVEEMRDTWLGSTIKKEEMTGKVVEFNMHIDEIEHELIDGTTAVAWAFGLEGQPATVPGPTLRAREGDLVKIHLQNNTTQPHSLHSHGITSLDELNDGVPHVTGAYIMPGDSFTYEFVVKEAGTHWYHCHVQTSLHQDMGMYGALIIEDTEEPTWDKEFVNIVDEWDTLRDPSDAAAKPEYNYFVVNGKAGSAVPDMLVEKDEIARVRLINAGFESHSLHLHGTHFLVTHKDGYLLPRPYNADTINIAPGETYDVFVKGREGTWPWHDHNSLAVTNDGVYPGGMIMHMRGSGEDPFDPDREVVRLPIEGEIHGHSDHANLSVGDPAFILRKMEINSGKWKSASAKERKALHAANQKLGTSIGGIYNVKTGDWIYSTGNPTVIPAVPEAEAPSIGIELGAMKAPVIIKNAVEVDAKVGNAVAFDATAPAQSVKGNIVEVDLEAKKAMLEVNGELREVWTFNGSVPAPTIRVHQGDTVRINLTNKDKDMSHGLDFHAGQMDMGTFHQAIEPGAQMTFEFKANYPGVFYFHCSADPVIGHIANGMFGAVIVDPPGYEPKDKEYVIIQNEWYGEDAGMDEWIEGAPVAVAFNGIPSQYMDKPLTAKAGEDIRFYFVNAGINDFSAWHIIGQIFDTVYLDGNPDNGLEGVQTQLVPPGGAIITDLKAPEAGDYLMLTHQMNEAMRGGLGLLRIVE